MSRRFALIGHPLGHSLSPEIHRAILKMAGIDGTYELVDIPPEALAERLPSLLDAYDGLNVTIPHKPAVVPFLEGVSEAARRCGAVNTIVGRRGYNTDIEGFLSSRPPLAGAHVVLPGTGGVAAMMAAEALAAGAASLTVSSRAPEGAARFVASLRERVPGTRCVFAAVSDAEGLRAALSRATVLLNGTPLGMWPRAGVCPVEPDALPPGLFAFDPVYNPTPTRLLLAVRQAGGRAVGGLTMLVRQAVAAQRLWNPGVAIDAEAAVAELVPALRAELWRKNPANLLLTGFMGAGKSTVGRRVAERLGIAFCDLDAEIVAAAGCPVAEIFARDGEAGFRALETRVAADVLRRPCSQVVAAGGGFPMAPANRALVRETNTLVIGLEATFETLWARIAGDPGRPLARDRAAAESLFERRAPVYRAFRDAAVQTRPDDAPEAVAGRLLALLEP